MKRLNALRTDQTGDIRICLATHLASTMYRQLPYKTAFRKVDTKLRWNPRLIFSDYRAIVDFD